MIRMGMPSLLRTAEFAADAVAPAWQVATRSHVHYAELGTAQEYSWIERRTTSPIVDATSLDLDQLLAQPTALNLKLSFVDKFVLGELCADLAQEALRVIQSLNNHEDDIRQTTAHVRCGDNPPWGAECSLGDKPPKFGKLPTAWLVN